MSTGLRRGELLGLRWSDVDLATGLVTVRQALTKIKGGVSFEPTKSHRSDRPVEISRGLCDLLMRHRDQQALEKDRAGPIWQEHGLIFALEDGRRIPPSTPDRHYHAPLQRAGLPRMRLHDLRHTQATLLLAQGVHPKVVQERLGHSSICMHDDGPL